jgi:hypothetical protein
LQFQTKILKINKIQISNTETINYISYSLIFIGFGFMWIYHNVFETDIIIPIIILLIGYTLIFINFFLQYEDFEKINFDYCGIFKFNENIIEFNDLTIPLNELKKFEIIVDGYYGERINSMRTYSGRLPSEKNSLGVKNKIKLTHNSKNYEFTFNLRSETDLKNLNVVLYKAIMMRKLTNLDPKASIKLIPKMYIKYDETREYISLFIKSNQISSTEGLLYMEYETDNEAKELRKKYCA